MSAALDGAVELLERALAYTSAALGGVDEATPGALAAPTPCTGWDLARLLAHMEDALDAFTEAAGGVVEVHQAPARESTVETLRAKACALLAAWVGAPATRVDLGAASLEAPVLVAAAALEVTVHGWDVAQATGTDLRIPDDLAAGLLGIARGLVGPGDRVSRFAAPLETPGHPSYDERLLAWLGRRPAPTDEPRFWERRGLRAG